MEPFFIEPRGVFAGYYSPSDGLARQLLVICPPLFDEYRRTARFLSDFAAEQARNGCHVVRFDYAGTEESRGDWRDARVGDWQRDLSAVIDEGLAISGAEFVDVLGVRFGALMASQASHPKIRRRVLWDPMSSGREILANLDAFDRYLQERKAQRGAVDAEQARHFRVPLQWRNALDELHLSHENQHATQVICSRSQVPEGLHATKLHRVEPHYDWPLYTDGQHSSRPVALAIAEALT